MNLSITKRTRRRMTTAGDHVQQTRFIINYRESGTGIRRQLFFDKLKQAQYKRAELIAALDRNAYVPVRNSLTVADVVASWLEAKRAVLKPNTIPGYEARCHLIVGPLLPTHARQSRSRSGVGVAPKCELIPLLGGVRVSELTTRQICRWHALIASDVGIYSANKAAMLFKAALAVAAEDGGFRPPVFPTGLQRRSDRPAKRLLVSSQIAAAFHSDKAVYCAFPFLTGLRSSEMLGLLWSDVDLGRGVIRIRRVQVKRSGELIEATKTAAGTRDIPMSPVLRDLLISWRSRCPLLCGAPHRVFPGPEGGPLFYNNYRTRFWVPTLARLGLPAVSPHSARHAFISTLQAHGVDVATAAKLAGHKSPAVTLGFYTHSVSDADAAVGVLDRAFATEAVTERMASARSDCADAPNEG